MYRILFLAFLTSIPLKAESIFGNWGASGNGCNGNSVYVVANGQSIGVLFDGYSVDLIAGARPEGKNNLTCNFHVDVIAAPGMELAGFSQLYSGCIIKSAGASARLSIHYQLANVSKNKEIRWDAGREISPEDPESIFFQNYSDTIPTRGCGARTQYKIKLHLQAKRKDVNDFVVGGMDSVDADVATNLKLVPHFRPCRR